ncbi:MAG: EAL domain-containing protein [Cyanothece sp. SIO2G6]|nr:EAL domain-containing protein [Cyanothece sp. SIO2G6]
MQTKINALFIEDNPSDALLFDTIISASSDFVAPTLHHIRRFKDALTALETQTFDLVVLDLSLPDGEGIGLVQRLRAVIPQVPIIILTGHQSQDLAIAAIQEGVQDYLVKTEILSPERLTQVGYVDIGNLLVKRLKYAIERAELVRQLEASKERYALATEGVNDGIWDWDLTNNHVYYSNRWQAFLGLAIGEIGDRPEDWISRIHPDDRPHFDEQLRQHLDRQQPQFRCEYRILHKDGTYRWMLTRGVALWNDDGIPQRMAGSQTDMTERKLLEQALFQEKELAQITLQSIGDAVITTDELGYIQNFNPVAERLTGWKAENAKYRPIEEVCQLVDGSNRKRLENPAICALKVGEPVSLSNHPTLISKTGEEFAIGDSAAPIRSDSGDILGTVLVFHDVTEERGRAQQLAWHASHDPLTQLYNRERFIQVVSDAIHEAQNHNDSHVLCYLDLDHFKAVNDTCGHAAGDELLCQVAALWQSKIRRSDVLARVGGDEFGLLLYNCTVERAVAIADDFCDSIQAFRFLYEGKIFTIGVSIGVVAITKNSIDTKQVLRLADAACYTAKEKGRNRTQLYSPDDDNIIQQSMDSQWFSRLTQALDNDQFHLYYQSIANVIAVTQKPETQPYNSTNSNPENSDLENSNPENSDLKLCEILLRLPHPETGQISLPAAFMAPAERYDLMPKIDRWVVENLLEYLRSHSPTANTIYCVNLSGASINDDQFIEFLGHQLQQHDVDPKILCFEITETVAISNLYRAANFILELKKLGCHFALDDFGSGMSSFAYLKHLPVDYLKIDGNFVKDALTDDVLAAMLEAINNIGHLMGLKTIAEYVENQDILDRMKTLGIDYVQGYVIDYPQPLQQDV